MPWRIAKSEHMTLVHVMMWLPSSVIRSPSISQDKLCKETFDCAQDRSDCETRRFTEGDSPGVPIFCGSIWMTLVSSVQEVGYWIAFPDARTLPTSC